MFIWILLVIGIIMILCFVFTAVYFWDNGMRFMRINKARETYKQHLSTIPSYGKAWDYFIMGYYLPSSKLKVFKGINTQFNIEREISGDRIIPLIRDGNDYLSKNGIDHVFIINLDRSPQRLERTIKMYKQNGFNNLTRMKAFDGRNEVNEMKHNLPEFSVNDLNKLDELNIFLEAISYKYLKSGHQGCTCSHIYLWKYIYQNKIPIAVISEDDVCLHPNFQQLFVDSWQRRPDGVLFNYNITNYECRKCEDYNQPTWVKNAGGSATFYIITYEGAKRLLTAFSKHNFPTLPCADDVPFMTVPDSYKLYYNNSNVFSNIPLCGNRNCGIVSTPESENSSSVIREVNQLEISWI